MVDVTAQMVANVMDVPASAGDRVEAGQTLVVVESMKMQIPVTAPVAGVVERVEVSVGDVVQEGDLIAVVTPR